MRLTQEHYDQIAHCFPKHRGSLTYDNLQVLNAILYIAENGAKWRRLPAEFGHWHTIYARMRVWAKSGVLARAFGRLLVRLFAEGNPPWRLKGGYALELKLAMARTTRDLDLGLSAEGIGARDLLEILQTSAFRDAGDFFAFTIGKPIMDLDGAPYGGSRHPVEAHLDGRLFARFHLDVQHGRCAAGAVRVDRAVGMAGVRRNGSWEIPLDFTGGTFRAKIACLHAAARRAIEYPGEGFGRSGAANRRRWARPPTTRPRCGRYVPPEDDA